MIDPGLTQSQLIYEVSQVVTLGARGKGRGAAGPNEANRTRYVGPMLSFYAVIIGDARERLHQIILCMCYEASLLSFVSGPDRILDADM